MSHTPWLLHHQPPNRQEYKIHNCELLFKEDIDVDALIDIIEVRASHRMGLCVQSHVTGVANCVLPHVRDCPIIELCARVASHGACVQWSHACDRPVASCVWPHVRDSPEQLAVAWLVEYSAGRLPACMHVWRRAGWTRTWGEKGGEGGYGGSMGLKL